MKLRLFYYLWIPDNGFSKTMDLHWFNLKCFSSVFDEALFFLAVNNNDSIYIHEAKEKIKNIGFQNVEIKVVKNLSVERESYYFKTELIDKLGEFNGLTFFAHSKGTSNRDLSHSYSEISTWINAMYYFNLNNINEVKEKLINDKYITYGAILQEQDAIPTKYQWMYTGTYFWINDLKLKQYIEKNQIQIEDLNNYVIKPFSEQERFYSEHFFSTVFPIEYAFSKQKTLNKTTDTSKYGGYINCYDYTKQILKDITEPEELNNFYKFYNKKNMKLRLVCYYWIPSYGYSKIMDVHYNCLKYYKDIFDEALFVLSIDDLDNQQRIEEFKNIISSIGFKNLQFKVRKNDLLLRESIVFKEEVMDKLDDYDGLTFFVHTKGNSENDSKNHEFKNISNWVAQMYFFSLNFIDDVKEKLINNDFYLTYGGMLMETPNIATNKYVWYYPGNCFWLNGKRIMQYVKENNLEIPGLNNWSTVYYSGEGRYYAECVVGSIFPLEKAASSLDIYYGDYIFYYDCEHIKDKTTPEKYFAYKNFYNNIALKDKCDIVKNKICVYAICKNESKHIDRWAPSMLEADCVVVLDTGSSDDSVEKLKSYGIKVEQKTINPWRFDVARNESMKLIPDDCNILVCTDLDEYFEPGWAKILRDNWIEGKHNMATYYKYNIFPGNDGIYNEIHSKGYKWRFPVHECLYNEKEEYNILHLEDKIFLHHEQDFKESRNSYFELLKLRKEENPNDNLGIVFYIGECLEKNLNDDVIEESKKLLNKKEFTDTLSKWYIYKCLAIAYANIGKLNEAENSFLKMLETDPENIIGYINYAEFLNNNKKDIKNGLNILKLGLKNSKYNVAWSYNKNSLNSIYDYLSLFSFYSGDKLSSLAYAYKAFKLNENDERLKSNLNIILNSMNTEDFA